MIDEGPSEEDLARFSGDTAHCPDCGAEVYDQAEYCQECNQPIGGGSSRPPIDAWWRQRWILLTTIIAILLLLGWFAWL